jgi:hypothetical protein
MSNPSGDEPPGPARASPTGLARARLETREIVQVERLVASWLIGRARS